MGTNEPTPASQHPSSGSHFEVLLQAPLTDPYTPLPAGILSPQALVKIDVRSDDSEFRQLSFIVDTGALISAIPMYLARQNRIPFTTEKKRQVPILGIAGIVNNSYLGEIHLRIKNELCTIPCLFFDNGSGQGPAILGRAGFLEKYDIQIVRWHIFIGKHR